MKTFKEFFTLDERSMSFRQKVVQMQHYWNNLDHMASDERKKKNMKMRFGIKNIKLDKKGGKLVSFDEEANSKYIVSKNPSDKKWYAMGHVGNNKWMPVSNGFKNKAQAQKWTKSQDKVDNAARGEISGV
jgi:hypothetical protein